MTQEQRRCKGCGIPLRPSQSAAETCSSPRCRLRHPPASGLLQRKAAALDAQEKESERREAIDRMTREHERELRDRHGAAIPERVIHARLPANEESIVPLSDERRGTFAANLAAALDRAMEDPDRPFPLAPEQPPSQAPLIRSACTACRGSCCKYGGDRAYLYPDHFRKLLRDHPEKSREEILSEYLSRLPVEAYQDSCVYHTETGCSLPRDLRSNLCNTFLCGGLADMLEAQSREAAPLPVLAFCIKDHGSDLVRSTLFDPQGTLLR